MGTTFLALLKVDVAELAFGRLRFIRRLLFYPIGIGKTDWQELCRLSLDEVKVKRRRCHYDGNPDRLPDEEI
jgi:hypothetical protein